MKKTLLAGLAALALAGCAKDKEQNVINEGGREPVYVGQVTRFGTPLEMYKSYSEYGESLKVFYLEGYTQVWDMYREPSENKNKASSEQWTIKYLPDATCESETYWLYVHDNIYPFNKNISWGIRMETWEDIGCDGKVDRILFNTEFQENLPYNTLHEISEIADREILRDTLDMQFMEKRNEFASYFDMPQKETY
ncbi:MAG: hypothetical protein WC852_05975 [Candidatus Nanoarchaeia archaeon]|jgi:hypothetical protein